MSLESQAKDNNITDQWTEANRDRIYKKIYQEIDSIKTSLDEILKKGITGEELNQLREKKQGLEELGYYAKTAPVEFLEENRHFFSSFIE